MEAILAQIEDPEQRQEFEEQMTLAEKAQVTNFTRISDMYVFLKCPSRSTAY